MCPDPVNPWLDPGPPHSPQTNKGTTSKEQQNPIPPSPPPPTNNSNNNKARVSKRLTPLDLGEPAMDDEFEYSHLERNFDGKKMLWERVDGEENAEEVLREEEVVREKRRRERKERVRSGPLTKAQRKLRREGKMDELEEDWEEYGEEGEGNVEE